jgi:methylated-DNA-[protein]-cysteine S-methyltransferase
MRHGHDVIVFKTPFGWAGAAVSGQRISRVVLPKKLKKAVQEELNSSEFPRFVHPRTGFVRSSVQNRSSRSVLKKSRDLLEKYFSGKAVSFDLPLDLHFYTAFQQAVWKAAAKIPYGETRSYAWIAERIGNAKAARAVGQAMGANPFPIIVP